MNDLATIPDLMAEYLRRVNAYTDEVTYYGPNSWSFATARATAEMVADNGERLYRGLIRRHTLIGASGDALTEVLEEHGTPRLGPARARAFVILRPYVTTITAVSGGLIEVDDASHFEAGSSIRVATDDGAQSEIATVVAITEGTGPNGGDELDVGALVGSYASGDVVLLRGTISAGTILTSTSGAQYATLEETTVGDANPVMQGESTSLALADKVWVESLVTGEDGNADALTIDALQTPNDAVREVLNPFRADGGTTEERDFDAKYRAAHLAQLQAVDTHASLEASATRGDTDIRRAFAEDADDVSTIRIRVLTRSGAPLSQTRRAALEAYLAQHLRSRVGIEVRNVQATAIEVVATVSLEPGTDTIPVRLRAAWRSAADRLATYVDWRRWPENSEVQAAELLGLVNRATGIANVVTETFQPSADVAVPAASVPMLVRLTLVELSTGEPFGADLRTTY